MRWRVGAGGVRISTGDGSGYYTLPAGTLLDELPGKYLGELVEVDDDAGPTPVDPRVKRFSGYANKRVWPAEDKG